MNRHGLPRCSDMASCMIGAMHASAHFIAQCAGCDGPHVNATRAQCAVAQPGRYGARAMHHGCAQVRHRIFLKRNRLHMCTSAFPSAYYFSMLWSQQSLYITPCPSPCQDFPRLQRLRAPMFDSKVFKLAQRAAGRDIVTSLMPLPAKAAKGQPQAKGNSTRQGTQAQPE